MSGFLTDAIDSLAVIITNNNPIEQSDYYGEDGLLRCGKCHTRKEGIYNFGEKLGEKKMPCLCKCKSEELDKQKEEERKWQFKRKCERLRKDGIADPSYLAQTFSKDDGRNPKISKICWEYAEHWDEMKADNIGILFYGSVGTGKSFQACCIAHALIDKGVSVCVTNFPRILNKLQGFGEDKQTFLDQLNRYDLLVIDDLGVERDTSYSVEQIFNIIDARSRSGKPLIVTTNLSLSDLKNPSSLEYSRIYDRILEMCPIKLKITGESRRTINTAEKCERAKRILGL